MWVDVALVGGAHLFDPITYVATNRVGARGARGREFELEAPAGAQKLGHVYTTVTEPAPSSAPADDARHRTDDGARGRPSRAPQADGERERSVHPTLL